MIDLQATELRTFLPAQDFDLAKQFYTALGARIDWCDEHLALLSLAGSSFYLQKHYAKDWAENCMLHLAVQDAQGCFAQITALLASGRFPNARVATPRQEAHGALVTYVWDPSGVLLHLAQWT